VTVLFPRSNHVVTARFVIRPDSVNTMRVIAHDLTTASRAENGCILYYFAESAEKEGVFTLLIIWRDAASYQRYAASDYVRAFMSNLAAGMLEKPPVYETWRSLG
jgi:quinol monooxygenase YgiN